MPDGSGVAKSQYSLKDPTGLNEEVKRIEAQAKAQAALDSQKGLTKKQKADLWTIINESWKKNPHKD